MDQNLNYYKIFYEVAKAGNISNAAETLYISQPAVSKSITNLEQALNHTLFIRSKKGVKLTEEGETLYQHLSVAFESIEIAEKNLKRIDQLGMGHLRIGVSTSLCKYILLPYLQDFIREHPHVKVSIECNPTYETIQLLKQGKIDIGLICETPLNKQFHFMPLRSIQDTFVTTQTYLDNLILREHDTLESQPHETDYDDLSIENSEQEDAFQNIPNVAGLLLFTEPVTKHSDASLSAKEILEKANLMLLDKGNISRNYIDAYFETNDIQPAQILEINNMDLLIDFACIGMGVACVVKEFVSSQIASGQIIEISPEDTIPKRTIGFIYDESMLSHTCKKFIGFCK